MVARGHFLGDSDGASLAAKPVLHPWQLEGHLEGESSGEVLAVNPAIKY